MPITLTPLSFFFSVQLELIAMVERDADLPADVKAQLLQDLQADAVPAATLDRLDSRMGG